MSRSKKLNVILVRQLFFQSKVQKHTLPENRKISTVCTQKLRKRQVLLLNGFPDHSRQFRTYKHPPINIKQEGEEQKTSQNGPKEEEETKEEDGSEETSSSSQDIIEFQTRLRSLWKYSNKKILHNIQKEKDVNTFLPLFIVDMMSYLFCSLCQNKLRISVAL